MGTSERSGQLTVISLKKVNMDSVGTAGPTTVSLLFTINRPLVKRAFEGLQWKSLREIKCSRTRIQNPSLQSKVRGSLQQNGAASFTQQADQAAMGRDDARMKTHSLFNAQMGLNRLQKML